MQSHGGRATNCIVVTENTFNMVIETWKDSLHRICTSTKSPTMENGLVLASQQQQEQTKAVSSITQSYIFGVVLLDSQLFHFPFGRASGVFAKAGNGVLSVADTSRLATNAESTKYTYQLPVCLSLDFAETA